MAAKGLHLDKMAKYFAWFDRGEPMENVRFRLEPVTKDDDWMTAEEREDFHAMGWEYLDTWENLYRIFRADDPAAPELHTDPKTQALTLDRLIRKTARGYAIGAAVWIACCALLFFTAEDFVDQLRLSFVYVDLSIICWTGIIFFDRGGLLDLLDLRRTLRKGEPQPHPAIRRFGLPAGLISLLLALLPFFNAIMTLTDYPHYRTVTDPAGLPYVSLEVIENDPGFERLTDSTPPWGQDYFNSYHRTRSLLVPEYCTTNQYGRVEGRDWEYVEKNSFEEGEYVPDAYDPQLHITRVRLLTEGLAARVYDSFEGDLIAGEVIESDALDFDESVFLTAAPADDAPRTRILIREGRTVLYAAYYGEADLTEYLDEFTALLD